MSEEKAAEFTVTAAAPDPAPAAADNADDAGEKREKKEFGPVGVRLHVKNLGNEMTSEELKGLFTPFGEVKGGEVKTTDEGKCKGFGFVIMSSEEDANKAIADLHGKKNGENMLSVVVAPGKGKEKGKGKGDDGKGKGKDNKGKGKGKNKGGSVDPYAQYGAAPSPYNDPAMMQQMQMMQMQQMQFYMMQQAYAMQMYGYGMQGLPAQPPPAPAAAAEPAPRAEKGEKGKGKGKGQGKGKGKAKNEGGDRSDLPPAPSADQVFVGTLKSLNPTHGYGFIDCKEMKQSYDRDVYVSSDGVPSGAKVGDTVKFNISISDKGHPRAMNIASIS